MLNNHSYYSLRFGILQPAELIALAGEMGYDRLVLTDINCTAGILEYVRLADRHEKKFTALAGVDFRNGAAQQYVAIARNNQGYYEICSHLSAHLHEKRDFEPRAPHFQDSFVIYPMDAIHADEAHTLAAHEFVGIALHDIGRLRFSPWKAHHQKIALLHTVTFRNKRDFNAHRLLRAVDNNILLSRLSDTEEGDPRHVMHSYQEVKTALAEFPFVLENTERILRSCSLNLGVKQGIHRNQKYFTGSEEGDNEMLIELCNQGLTYRYPNASPQVQERLHKELNLIREQKFVSYFLINWDIVRYARSKEYYYVGRGSGANSIVAYLLLITDVDPLELDLYFERFINSFRQNPPDFDIDFSWKDREDVTDYIFSRYEHVALMGTCVTFHHSGLMRELGKVFGLPKSEIDILSDGKFRAQDLDSLQQLVLKYSLYLRNFPNYLSVHASGIVITELDVHHYGATFLPPKGYPTTHFDMHQADDIGINKLDILSQRGLAKIKDALEIIRENQGIDVDIHDIDRFKKDGPSNELLRTADAIGCFYVESPAMRMLLTKLQTHDYLGLVAASSIIRPGVASSGMMRTYVERERDERKRKEGPEILYNLMPDTYGIMVYQEDVIKVAHEFAGLTLGEADALRRGMSGKYRGREEFREASDKFIAGALAKGHPRELVDEVWRQTESFAGYAFAKGHSASYAVESYQCLYLKAWYPLEYMTATINNYGGFYRTEIYVHEARMKGATTHAPCVNISRSGAVLHGKDLTLGLEMIRELQEDVRNNILQARADIAFSSLDDFLDRVKISLDQCVLLARIGAFRFTGLGKKELLWRLHFRLARTKSTNPESLLFAPPKRDAKLPELEHHWLEDAYDELELIGFPLCNAFDLVGERIEDEVVARELRDLVGKPVRTIGYLTTLKPTSTRKGESMYFGTFLDREGQFLDTVHFPDTAKEYRISGWGLFLIEGMVLCEHDAISIQVTFIRRLKLLGDPRIEDVGIHPALLRKNSGTDRWMSRHFEPGVS